MAVQAPRRAATQSEEWGVTRFLREVYDELRKVVWPTPEELYRYTVVVVITVVIIAVFIGGADAGVQEFAKRYIYTGLNQAGTPTPHR